MTNNEILQNALAEILYQENMRSNGFPYQVNNLVVAEIVSALEKQIPKKPIPRFINDFSDDMAINCPCCKQPIVNVWNKRDYKPLYCHYCGQALDWGGG